MKVARVGILGAGTMGRGIAQVAALGGFETRLYDVLPEAAESAAVKIREALAKGSVRGRWSETEADAAANRIGPALALCMKHPSAGFSSEQWRPVVRRLLDEARAAQAAG